MDFSVGALANDPTIGMETTRETTEHFILGYVALMLGAVALIVALVGQTDFFHLGRNNQMRGNSAQAALPAQTAPQTQQNAATAGNQGRNGSHAQNTQGSTRGPKNADARTDGHGFDREHAGIFGPLAWIGNLAQGGVAIVAILLGLMLLQRHRSDGGSGSRTYGDVTPPEDENQQVSNPAQSGKTEYI